MKLVLLLTLQALILPSFHIIDYALSAKESAVAALSAAKEAALTAAKGAAKAQGSSPTDITVHLYTRSNPNVSEDYFLDVNSIKNSSNFNPDRLNVFIIHGWGSDRYHKMNIAVRDASLIAGDVNLFIVDWSGPASGFYFNAIHSVPRVGKSLGRFIGEMQKALNVGADNFQLIGYSVGCQVAGVVGSTIKGKIGAIVALDAAGPFFRFIVKNYKLDRSDAQFVQALHTSDAFLGYRGRLGHVDIVINGGRTQRGCGIDIFGECSHERSYLYYVESLLHGGFTAWRCPNCWSFKKGKCRNNPTTRLGGLPLDKSAPEGVYYLTTNSEPPFSKE